MAVSLQRGMAVIDRGDGGVGWILVEILLVPARIGDALKW